MIVLSAFLIAVHKLRSVFAVLCFKWFLILDQAFSIGFSNGEYGGKNIRFAPVDSINTLLFQIYDIASYPLSLSSPVLIRGKGTFQPM